MQTFLPYPDYAKCAAVLDSRRLGKQIIECGQIMRGQWANHPVSRMWQGHHASLRDYLQACAYEWFKRYGREHGSYTKFKAWWAEQAFNWIPATKPAWLDDALCLKYRAHLLAKNPEHYGSRKWKVEPRLMTREDYPEVTNG